MKLVVIPVTPIQQNCSVLWCEKTMRGAVVDPGGDVDEIASVIEAEGIKIEKILITHGHFDHVGGAAELAERYGVPIEGPHREDEYLTSAVEEAAAEFGVRDARSFTPTRWLEEGETVTVGPYSFDVLHCPGHTPGHVVFVHAPERVALVGDVLFRGSVGRTDFPRGDHAALIRSIKEKLLPLGDDVTFVPGHGQPSTIGAERRGNPFLR